MSEEEKETIRFLRVFSRTDFDYCKLEKADVLDILNVITKLHKEIEELKEKEKNLLYQLKDSERELLEVTQNIINKDKIREILNNYLFTDGEGLKEFYQDIFELLEE